MKKNFLAFIAVALLCVGLTACGGGQAENNPLNVQAPEWKQFIVPKVENPKIYKQANENSPVLRTSITTDYADVYEARMYWSDETAPRGRFTEHWIVAENSTYPILGEEGDFYKVYVFNEVVGAVEGFMKKAECNVVEPALLTPELIDSIGKMEGRCDNIVREGDLENLCISSFQVDYDEEPYIIMGQLCGNCIVYPHGYTAALSIVPETTPVTFTKVESGKGFMLRGSEDLLFQPNPVQASVLDTKKLSTELIQQMYNDLKTEKPELKEVLYYIPEVQKEQFIHVMIVPTANNKGESKEGVSATTAKSADDPETIVRQVIERAMARDMEGVAELLAGQPGNVESLKKLLVVAFSEVKSYNIRKTEINGNQAIVRYTVKFKYDSEKDKFDMVKTSDGWKVNADK